MPTATLLIKILIIEGDYSHQYISFWQEDRIHAQYPNPFDYIRGGTDGNKVDFFRPDQTLFMEDGSYFKIMVFP